MAKQLLFKSNYVELLKQNVIQGTTLEFYKNKEFIYEDKQTLMIPNIEHTPNLTQRLNHKDDFNTAILVYEAFKELEPIQASDERLWVYLSYVDLYPYMIKRWSGVYNGTEKDEKGYILSHWFVKSISQAGLIRNWLSSLWWAVYLSIDENRVDKYELTKLFFRQLDFATRTMGAEKFGRHKEAVIGILEFMKENDELFKSKFEDKSRFIARYINLIGGTKPLGYFKRDFFKAELGKIKGKLLSI